MHDLLILGGGPAGMTAAVYAARKQLHTLLLSSDLGGQMNWTMGIENYMGYQLVGGIELMEKFKAQVEQFPIDMETGETLARLSSIKGGFEATTESGKTYQGKAVIIATGKRPRHLGVPGEALLVGRGVSYCAICDGPFFKGLKVAVIGGGNSALEAVLDLIKIADHVFLVARTQLTGDQVLIDKVKDVPNLTVLLEQEILAIKGKDLVSAITVKDKKANEEKDLNVEGVFVEIGLIPNSGFVRNVLTLNERDEIKVNCSCETGVPGLYAAGDVTDIPEKQIVVAAGEGAKAALQAHRYLQRLL
jgi:alkyl hydroperoxide reductase subunit F